MLQADQVCFKIRPRTL